MHWEAVPPSERNSNSVTRVKSRTVRMVLGTVGQSLHRCSAVITRNNSGVNYVIRKNKYSTLLLGLLATSASFAQVCTKVGDPNGSPAEQAWHQYYNQTMQVTSRTYSDNKNAISFVTFNALQLNCFGGGANHDDEQLNRFVGYISEARPDVVFLQEVCNEIEGGVDANNDGVLDEEDGVWEQLKQKTTGYTLLRRVSPDANFSDYDGQGNYTGSAWANAYLVKDATVTVLENELLFLDDAPHWADANYPWMLKVRVNKGLNVLDDLYLVNYHAKAGDALADYDRRAAASLAIEEWMAVDMQGEKVVLAGDFNDRVYESITPNQDSPYQNMVDNPDIDVVTVCNDQNGQRTKKNGFDYVGTFIDHVAVSSEVTYLLNSAHVDNVLFGNYENASQVQGNWTDFEVNDVYSVGDGSWDYVLSDHAPVRFAITFPQRPQVGTPPGNIYIGSYAAPGSNGLYTVSAQVQGMDLLGDGLAATLTNNATGKRHAVQVMDRDLLSLGELRGSSTYTLEVFDIFTGQRQSKKFSLR